MKKIILPALSLAAILALTNTMAFAEYNSNKVTNSTEVSTKQNLQVNSIIINETVLENAKTYKSNDKLMIPIRAIAEELGFEVKWENGTIMLINGAQYITFKLDEDGYTFARTAPIPLGKAPELKDGITYVPVDILTEIMNLNVTISENNSIIINKEESNDTDKEIETDINKISYTAEIIELGDNYILVNDSEKGEVKLNISDNTKISKSNSEDATINDLKIGDSLYVVYGEAMTFSLPPMNNPERIIVKVDSREQVKGNIEFSEDIKDNQVMVNDPILGDVILNISDDTEIVDEDGNKMDKSIIKKNMSAIVTYGEAMTASLPPMNNPVKIVITENHAFNTNNSSSGSSQVKEESLSFTGKINGIEENGMLLFEDEESKNIYALNIDENTIIIDSNNKTISKDDLKNDSNVSVKVSPKMTRSIPPQTYTFEIKLLNK